MRRASPAREERKRARKRAMVARGLALLSLLALICIVCGASESLPLGFVALCGVLFLALTVLFCDLGGLFK